MDPIDVPWVPETQAQTKARLQLMAIENDQCIDVGASDHPAGRVRSRARSTAAASTPSATAPAAPLPAARPSKRGMSEASQRILWRGARPRVSIDVDNDMGDNDMGDMDAGCPSSPPVESAAAGSKGTRGKLEKRDRVWLDEQPAMQARVMRAAPMTNARFLQQRQRELTDLQHCVNNAWVFGLGRGLPTSRLGGCGCNAPNVVELWLPGKPQRLVTVFSYRSRHAVRLPQLKCVACHKSFEPRAEDKRFKHRVKPVPIGLPYVI
jgi:hypothetical protein